jgi:hypothetical protein
VLLNLTNGAILCTFPPRVCIVLQFVRSEFLSYNARYPLECLFFTCVTSIFVDFLYLLISYGLAAQWAVHLNLTNGAILCTFPPRVCIVLQFVCSKFLSYNARYLLECLFLTCVTSICVDFLYLLISYGLAAQWAVLLNLTNGAIFLHFSSMCVHSVAICLFWISFLQC